MSGRGVDKAFGWSCTVALSALSVWGYQTVPWMGLPLAVNLVLLLLVYPLVPVVSRSLWAGYDSLDEGKKKKSLWINTTVSLLHSAVVSVLSAWAAWTSCTGDEDLLSAPTHASVYVCLCGSLGYFFYDTWDFIQSGLWRKSRHIVAHHIVLIFCMWLGVFKTIAPRYLVLCLLCEFNSVFLHLRTLMSMAGYTYRDALYRSVWKLNWFTFYVTRIPSHAVLFLLLIRDYPRWAAVTHPVFWCLAELGLVVFNVLNYKLYFDVRKTEAKDIAKAKA